MNWHLPHRPGKPRGFLRRTLHAAGPTWLASPWRRLVQTACLVLFLGLFAYVSWPYTAQPARVWHGWVPAEVDASTGKITLSADAPADPPIAAGAILHVVEPSGGDDGYLGPFRVTEAGPKRLCLEPARPLDSQQLDRLAASFGPWSLRQTRPGDWPSHYADDLRAKQWLPADTFLAMDPLVGISAALASRTWLWPLVLAGAVLAVCLVVPRGFCGYVCPLGTLLDAFDWAVSRRIERLRLPANAWWRNLRYAILAATLAAAACGVLMSGYVAPLPVLTRGLAFLLTPLEIVPVRGWHQVPPPGPGEILSIALFLAIPLLGLLQPRFWCKCLCPSGAMFSLVNRLRLVGRRVEANCIGCGKCVQICPLDAVEYDYSTRSADCAFCQTCGGVCPTRAIQFGWRWSRPKAPQIPLPLGEGRGEGSEGGPGDAPSHNLPLPPGEGRGEGRPGESPSQNLALPLGEGRGEGRPGESPSQNLPLPLGEGRGEGRPREAGASACSAPKAFSPQPNPLPKGEGIATNLPLPKGEGIGSRRRFVRDAIGGALGGFAGLAAAWTVGRLRISSGIRFPIRPPGSVPEKQFLQLCIRCGACYQACPNSVLQPLGFAFGPDALWTPHAVPDWSGCEPSCANCGQVCPTGAIRPLSLEEKRATHMGLAVVNRGTCLPYAGTGTCRLCIDECIKAGYQAIDPVGYGTQTDAAGRPVEGTGRVGPVVQPAKCVGCGLCQTRCRAINVVEKRLLRESAIQVEAGPGKEERLSAASFRTVAGAPATICDRGFVGPQGRAQR